jgi:hypothetical protein
LQQPRFGRSCPIHDACEPIGQHAEQHADARQQEHRREGQLDRVRDVDDLDGLHARRLRAHILGQPAGSTRGVFAARGRLEQHARKRVAAMSGFKDHFSRQSTAYSLHRPDIRSS